MVSWGDGTSSEFNMALALGLTILRVVSIFKALTTDNLAKIFSKIPTFTLGNLSSPPAHLLDIVFTQAGGH